MVGRLVRGFLPGLLLVLTLLVVALRQLRQPVNLDTFFHLRLGAEFLDGWTPWHPGSVTSFATGRWVPTQWLSQVGLAETERLAGLRGVLWVAAVAGLLLVAAVGWAARREASWSVAAPLTAVVVAICLPSLSARPQVLSYALVAVVVAAWLATARDGRPRWWLVPLTWLWALLHGMWPVAIALGLAAGLGVVAQPPDGVERRRAARVLAVPVASALVAAVTPAGPALYGAVLAVGSRAHYFSEWRPPDYRERPALLLLLLLLALLAARVRADRDHWAADLLLLETVGWAVYSARTVPVAAVLAAVLLARQLGRSGIVPAAPPERRERGRLAVATAAVAALAAVLAAVMPDPSPQEPPWLPGALAALPDGTPVVTDVQFGSYLMWAYPRLDPVFNGYADAYTDDELATEFDVLDLKPGWLRELDAQGWAYALVLTDMPLAYALRDLAGWRVVGSGDDLELLRRPDADRG